MQSFSEQIVKIIMDDNGDLAFLNLLARAEDLEVHRSVIKRVNDRNLIRWTLAGKGVTLLSLDSKFYWANFQCRPNRDYPDGYTGDLPFDLGHMRSRDEIVEKLGDPKINHSSRAGNVCDSGFVSLYYFLPPIHAVFWFRVGTKALHSLLLSNPRLSSVR